MDDTLKCTKAIYQEGSISYDRRRRQKIKKKNSHVHSFLIYQYWVHLIISKCFEREELEWR